jgi:hypothetical protein
MGLDYENKRTGIHSVPVIGGTMNRFLAFSAVIFYFSAALHGQVDITFFATSDVHFGQNSATKDANRNAMPDYLNGLPGKAYPAAVGGGVVGTPKGVLVPGDLIDYVDQNLWNQYVRDYGVKAEGRIKFPIYDGLGNHDYNGTGSLVVTALRNRNKARTGLASMDANNMHYSWEWDGVHFVQLNLYSGDVTQDRDPFKAYTFLQQDLANHVGSSGRPVIIMQHFPFPSSWWPNTEALKTATLLKKYNILGMLHGHSHGKKFYKYEGIDVWDDGTVMNGDILVFRITNNRMFVVNRIGNSWGTLVFQKDISMGTPTGLDPPKPGEGRLPGFRLTVNGVGEIYAGRSAPASVEVRSLSGRLVRTLPVVGSALAWDRLDQAGRGVPAGAYVVRIRTAAGLVHAKVVL